MLDEQFLGSTGGTNRFSVFQLSEFLICEGEKGRECIPDAEARLGIANLQPGMLLIQTSETVDDFSRTGRIPHRPLVYAP